jgi:hypothetical protein
VKGWDPDPEGSDISLQIRIPLKCFGSGTLLEVHIYYAVSRAQSGSFSKKPETSIKVAKMEVFTTSYISEQNNCKSHLLYAAPSKTNRLKKFSDSPDP